MKKILLFLVLFFPIIGMDKQHEQGSDCSPQLMEFCKLVASACCIYICGPKYRPPYTLPPQPRTTPPKAQLGMLSHRRTFQNIEE